MRDWSATMHFLLGMLLLAVLLLAVLLLIMRVQPVRTPYMLDRIPPSAARQ